MDIIIMICSIIQTIIVVFSFAFGIFIWKNNSYYIWKIKSINILKEGGFVKLNQAIQEAVKNGITDNPFSSETEPFQWCIFNMIINLMK